jgi:ABC-2 type transport system ATP-binding protein
MHDAAVISTHSLTRRFGELVAVNGLSLDVQRGEVFGFLGHNGAGKTTTIRLLNGVLGPSGGSARVLGLDPVTDGPTLRRRTGVLTESPSLDERLSARENLTIYANLYGVAEDQVKGRVESMLEMFELETRDSEKVGGFSKGMKQRLALARALIHRPELVYLDEPTAGLDPIAAKQVRELVRQMSQVEGHTVFMCTHNLPEAQRLCHRVAVLEHGSLIAAGTPAELGEQVMHTAQRVEVEVAHDAVGRALDVLRRLPGVRGVSAEVDVIGVLGAGREAVPGLLAALVEAGVRVYRVTPQEPSLEDVYFALHGDSVDAWGEEVVK